MIRRLVLPWLCGTFGPWCIESIGSNLRWDIRGQEHQAAVSGRAHVLVFWHARILLLAYHFRRSGYHVLVSENLDGELIARVVSRMGNDSLRGSTSRGGSRVLLSAARLLRRGRSIAFTPDGPRGPRHQFQAGALIAARLGGAPILPVTASVERAIVFRSWDRFVLPRGGARAIIQFLPPVPPAQKNDLESCRAALETSLAAATDRLDAELGLRIDG